jgi:hypothetical protein
MDYRSKERHRPTWQNRNVEEWGRDEEEADAKTHLREVTMVQTPYQLVISPKTAAPRLQPQDCSPKTAAPRLQPQDCSPKTAKTLGFDVPASLLARVGRVTE